MWVQHWVIVWLMGFELWRPLPTIVDFTKQVSSFWRITTWVQILLTPSAQSANMCVSLSLKGWIWCLLSTAILRLVEHSVISDVGVSVCPKSTWLRHLALDYVGSLIPWIRQVHALSNWFVDFRIFLNNAVFHGSFFPMGQRIALAHRVHNYSMRWDDRSWFGLWVHTADSDIKPLVLRGVFIALTSHIG